MDKILKVSISRIPRLDDQNPLESSIMGETLKKLNDEGWQIKDYKIVEEEFEHYDNDLVAILHLKR